MDSDTPRQRRPLWIAIVIIAAMLPVAGYACLLATASTQTSTEIRTLMWLYPLYVLAAGLCAWICWPRRKELTWIIIVLMLLTHAAMWILAKGSL